jgi:MoaA/NifB/PqqE/SkfB family radical SAM enzyme
MRLSQLLTSWRLLPKAIITFCVNLVATRIFNRQSWRGPLFVTWITTFDCNAFCGFCATHMLHRKYPQKLSLERSLELADEIAKSGTWMVGFTGGEVFLDSDLKKIVQRLKSHGLTVYIVTNGLLLKENAQWIIDSGVNFVTVSLDSDLSAEHDDIRKVEGLFNSAKEGMDEIRRLRVKSKPIVNISTVLMKQNLDRISQIVENLNKFADDVRIQPLTYGLPNSPHAREEERMNPFRFQSEEEREIRNKLTPQKWSKKFKGTYYEKFGDFWFNPNKLSKDVPCWAPFLRMVIYPDGNVLHCMANDDFGSVGNVREHSLMDVWNSQIIRQHRQVIGNNKNGCTCWTSDTSFNSFVKDIPLLNRLPCYGKPSKPTHASAEQMEN